jgi:hypothetical protein
MTLTQRPVRERPWVVPGVVLGVVLWAVLGAACRQRATVLA